jgi:two-component system, NarL family, sensor histidine kinase EvgS
MDASQMQRVLANLLQNAIKYFPASTAIGISARITDDGELELSVDDEGPGISAEERERIFDPFFRMRTAEQSEVSGHGLELAICQSIVLAHGGRIQVSDRPGGGAPSVYFCPHRCKRNSSTATTSRRTEAMTQQLTQQIILVADDETPMRKLLSSNLKASGYAVRTAADGTEALKLIDEHRFDLLLLESACLDPTGCRCSRPCDAVRTYQS